MGFMRRVGKLPGDLLDMATRHPGDLLPPGRGVGFDLGVIFCRKVILQPPIETIVSQHQIVDAGNMQLSAIGEGQGFYRQLAHQHRLLLHAAEVRVFVAAKVGESHSGDRVVGAQQRERQVGFLACRQRFKVPFAFLTPAEADRAVRHHQIARGGKCDGFPFRVIGFAQPVGKVGGAEHPARHVAAIVAGIEHHQHRHIGVATAVVEEIVARVVEVKLFQDHVAHCHGQGAVGALFRCQPLIAEFGHFRKVRRDGNGFGAFVAHFGKEVGVRGTGLRHVRPPGDDIAGVVPVGGFRHVGLFPPGHRRGGGQVAVPVIEAQAGPAQQGEIAGARSVRDHRHRRDRREARHPVRPVVFDGPDVGGGDKLVQLFPVRANKPTVTARLLVALALLRVIHDGVPGEHRIAVLAQRLAPQLNQLAAYQRVFQAVGAVEIPGVAGPARAAARLMVRQVGAGAGVVGLLGFPGDQAILDVDFPATGAGTVHAVSGPHNFVELPSLAIAVLPVAVGVHHLTVSICEGLAF